MLLHAKTGLDDDARQTVKWTLTNKSSFRCLRSAFNLEPISLQKIKIRNILLRKN